MIGYDDFLFYKRKTAYDMRISDWSSDVCSSDLGFRSAELSAKRGVELRRSKLGQRDALLPHIFPRAVGVARLARLVTLEEQELARAFIGIDLDRKSVV